jgi:hypothetical protein
MKSAVENVNKSKDMILKAWENCRSKVKQKLHRTGNEYINMLILKVVKKCLVVDCAVVTTDPKSENRSLFSISWLYLGEKKGPR